MATYEKTKVQQDSKQTALPDGSFQYSIRTTVLEQGELPHEYLFVFKILDPVDPKEDTFVRVGTPYDLETDTHKTSRDEALTAEQEFYLASTMLRTYDELETAVQAKEAIVSRVEGAVSAWITYMGDFAGVSEVLHPTGEPEIEQALVTAYTDAKQARIDAEAAVIASEAAVVLAEAVASLAADKAAIYQGQVNFCQNANQIYWANYYGAVQALTPQLTTFITASGVHTDDYQSMWDTLEGKYNLYSGVTYPVDVGIGDWAPIHDILQSNETKPSSYDTGPLQTIKNAQSTFQQNENYGASLNDLFATYCAAANANYNTAAADKSLKDKEVADSVTAKENANATLVAAQTAEDEALANILSLCPTFDSTSL